MGDTFQSISDGEKVAYTDAMTFVNVLNKADNGEFAKALEANGMSLEQFRDALNQTMDTSGNVDLAGMFSNIGLSMEMAGQDLEKGIQSFAEKRINYLENMKQFIISQQKISEALAESEIVIPSLKFTEDTQDTLIEVQNWANGIDAQVSSLINQTLTDAKSELTEQDIMKGETFTSLMFSSLGLTKEQVASFDSKQHSILQLKNLLPIIKKQQPPQIGM